MDEKKLLDKIKKATEYTDIPEKLEPDHIPGLLKGKKTNKTPNPSPVFKIAALAAALLIIFVIAWQYQPVRNTADGDAKDSEALNSSVETTAPKEEAAEVYADGEIAPVDSYNTLYNRLKESFTMKEETSHMLMDGAVMEAEAGAADKEESKYEGENTSDSDKGFSETNIQEMGVDEGDIIKTDGTYIYYCHTGSNVHIIRAQGQNMVETSKITLPSLDQSILEIYVDGDIMNIIASGSSTKLAEDSDSAYGFSRTDDCYVYTYDISNRSRPVLKGQLKQNGFYRTSRKNGNYLYLFTEYYPDIRGNEKNSTYVPEVNDEKMATDDIFLPDNLNNSSYLVVTGININQPAKVISQKSIVSAADQYYVSQDSIYISTTNWTSEKTVSQIMKFSYKDGNIKAEAAGEVPGTINNAFSMNAYNGYLRIVTTSWEETTRNGLYIMDNKMNLCSKIENLAPGETIQSARFFGNTGYFVTFRQMDPLFSVDLTDPNNPLILGELKITGFSSYLHFYGKSQLLGIGSEVDPNTGENLGIKLSMFDISDPSNVTEENKKVLKNIFRCPAMYEYKQVMIHPEKNIFGFQCENMFKLFTYDPNQGFVELMSYDGFPDDPDYCSYDDLRGIFIGRTFYLANKYNGTIQAFDMDNNYTLLNTIKL